MSKSTTFQDNIEPTTGPAQYTYDWATLANWTNGIPAIGDTVDLGSGTFASNDDIGNLSLTVLSQTAVAYGTINILANDALTIGVLSQSGAAQRLSFEVSGTLVDNSPVQTSPYYAGNYYGVSSTGKIIVNAAPTGEFEYATFGGTFAFAHPNATNSATIVGGGLGYLELPGTAVTGFSYTQASGLTVSTTAGTYAFPHFQAGQSLGYTSASIDAATGLLSIQLNSSGGTPTPASDTTAPTVVHDQPIAVNQDATAGIPASSLAFSDPDNTDSQLTYSILSGPAYGTLLKSGTAVSSFTQADIDNGLISYRENGSAISSDSFVFNVSDTAGNHSSNYSFQFQIAAAANSTVRLSDLDMWNTGKLQQVGSIQNGGGNYYYYTNVSGFDGYDFTNLSTSSNNAFVSWDSSYAAYDGIFFDGDRVLSDVYGGNNAGGTVRVNRSSSTSFTASSVDLDTYYAQSNVSVTFTGTRADGSSVSQIFYLDASQGMQTFTFNSSFTNLLALDFTPTSYVQFNNFVLSSTSASVVAASSDFNGDRTSDVLFRNVSNGDLGFYQVTNGVLQGWHDLALSSTAYSVVGGADFTGDGVCDVLLRNQSNGDIGFYQVTSAGTLGGWHHIAFSSADYTVVGTGDFNRDGISDILFRNGSNGDIGFYELNSDGSLQGWHQIAHSSSAYSIVGVADFNGDGVSDVLFRNNADGDLGFYQINADGSFNSWHDVAHSATAYSVVGTGDFNGDGTTDILFRNNSSGDVGFYQLNSDGSFNSWQDIATASTAYSVVGTGDYNGDGISDVLFRNTSDGDLGFYQMNSGGSLQGWHDLAHSSLAYTVVNCNTPGGVSI